MYFISYDTAIDDLKILRFSTSPFTFSNSYIKHGKEVIAFINYLKDKAITDSACYNMIYPWNDINYAEASNSEYIIVYNSTTNHIQGWCNIKYSKINSGDESIYTCFLKEIVVRTTPQIKGIGTLILEFIRSECFSNQIYLYDIGQLIIIKLHLLYLYSITTSIGFYKKTYLTNLGDIYKENELYKHVFIYLQDIHNRNTIELYNKFKDSLNLLHEFEVNSIMNNTEIEQYNSYRAPESCKAAKEIEEKYKEMLTSSHEQIKIETSKRRKIIRNYV